MLHGEIIVLPDAEAVAEAGARRFADAAAEAIAARGRFLVALAGGRTPRAMYERLSRPPYLSAIDWARVSFFFGDERCVLPEDGRQNFQMASDALFGRLPEPRALDVHRIRGEIDPEAAAREYDALLADRVPRFDLVLLGMGPEGHTASLFPHRPALRERARRAVYTRVPADPPDRVTLTRPVLDAARAVLLLVTGADKAPAIRACRAAPDDPGPLGEELPVLLVRPAGTLTWLLDHAAAS